MSSFWLDRSVLVTGATGLVGGHLVQQLLASGARAVCLVRDWNPASQVAQSGLADQLRIVWGDVRDQDLLERVLAENEVATVVHLAAQSSRRATEHNAVSTFSTNISGTLAVLEACHRSPRVAQIVLASADRAYGPQAELPSCELAPLDPIEPLDVSKACGELLARSYAKSMDLPVCIARYGRCFGPGDLRWHRLIPGTIRALLDNQPPLIRTDGGALRDYLYAPDAAAALMLLAEQMALQPDLQGDAFNFALEQPLTALHVVSQILSRMQSRLRPIIQQGQEGGTRRQSLSAAKARRLLGWKARYGFEEALDLTIDWYRQYLQDADSRRTLPLARSA